MTGLSACLPVYSTDAIRRKVVQFAFLLSPPFTEAENFEYICLPVSVPVGYLQQEERSFTTSLIFHSLRAPPFVTV